MVMEGQIDWTLVFAVLAVAGHVLALFAWIFAVTRRVRTEARGSALDEFQARAEAAETRLLEILNAIPVALVETDKQGKFVFANRAAHALLGRRDAELLGLRFHSATWGITYPDGRPIPPDLLPSARALRGQTVKGFQHLLANPATRRKMLVSVTAMPIETATGEVIGSTAAIVETEGLTQPVVEAEPVVIERPSEGDRLVRRVFEAASSALAVIDRDGCVREANPVAHALAGRDDMMIGGDFADLFLAEDGRDAARETLTGALTGADDAPDVLDAGTTRWRLLPLRDEAGEVEALLAAGERHDPEAESAEATAAPEPEADSVDVEALRAQVLAATVRAETAEAEVAKARAEAHAELESSRRLESVGRLAGGVSQDFHALLGVMTSALDMIVGQAEEPDRVRRLGLFRGRGRRPGSGGRPVGRGTRAGGPAATGRRSVRRSDAGNPGRAPDGAGRSGDAGRGAGRSGGQCGPVGRGLRGRAADARRRRPSGPDRRRRRPRHGRRHGAARHGALLHHAPGPRRSGAGPGPRLRPPVGR
jgi:PAS domain-containing protein